MHNVLSSAYTQRHPLSRQSSRVPLYIVCGLALLALMFPQRVSAQSEDVLDDPIVKGAWLYKGNCVGCHGDYEQERIGQGLEKSELKDKIYGNDREGCQVAWGKANGGPLGTKDVNALVAYIREWEALGQQPELPELPNQPTPTPSPTPTPPSDSEPTPTPTPTIDPAIVALQPYLDASEISHGVWQYYQNCYRCHGSYTLARMGMGVTADYVKTSIENGKTGTSMPPFSRRKGGTLKFGEIDAIVAYVSAYEQYDGPPAVPSYLVQVMNHAGSQGDDAETQQILLPDIPFVSGDRALGQTLYAEHCVLCHGEYGEGGRGAPLAKEWNSVRPDLTIRSAIRIGVPNTDMQAWAASNGGVLEHAEVDALTAYVVRLPATRILASGISSTGYTETPWGGKVSMLVLAIVALIIGAAIVLNKHT